MRTIKLYTPYNEIFLGCGKTSLIMDIIKNIETFAVSPPQKVVYFYKEWQDKFDVMKTSMGVEFIEDKRSILNEAAVSVDGIDTSG